MAIEDHPLYAAWCKATEQLALRKKFLDIANELQKPVLIDLAKRQYEEFSKEYENIVRQL